MNHTALSAESEAQLREAIARYELGIGEDRIVQHAVEFAALAATGPEDYTQVGNSRYGGVPDLPEGMEWPRDRRDIRATFLMQINLGAVPAVAGNPLPQQGMLYFFVRDWDDAQVIYADVDPATLRRAEEPAEGVAVEDLNELNPHKLSVAHAIDLPEWYSDTYNEITETLLEEIEDAEDRYADLIREMQGRERESWAGKLLGHPCWIGYDPGWMDPAVPNSAPNGWLLLALLDSNRAVNTLFGDAGYLQTYIHRDALAARDFSNIVTELESS